MCSLFQQEVKGLKADRSLIRTACIAHILLKLINTDIYIKLVLIYLSEMQVRLVVELDSDVYTWTSLVLIHLSFKFKRSVGKAIHNYVGLAICFKPFGFSSSFVVVFVFVCVFLNQNVG